MFRTAGNAQRVAESSDHLKAAANGGHSYRPRAIAIPERFEPGEAALNKIGEPFE
jgi:hypothetical protein